MLIDFFFCLKKHQLPVSLRELLDLLRALEKNAVFADIESFFYLARTVMVKDECHYDKFDRAFAEYFDGVQSLELFDKEIPDSWLEKLLDRQFSEEEKQKIQAMGGLDKLMETLKQRLEEQQKRHQGGNKWIGTGGTSPFGAYGFNPEGVRIGGKDDEGQRQAVKVWDKREFRNLDGDEELGTRNLKLALRKLRRFARSGASDELDLEQTIGATAKNAGLLDVKWRAERHNAVNVLILFDIGGSMDDHIQACEQLFAAARTEFKHLEFFYFHNCVYEHVWKDNRRRREEVFSVHDLMHTYGRDYKVIFVGDATMGPYEIFYPGGSVEHWNEEAGAVWLNRLTQHFDKFIWLNPQPEQIWHYYPSIKSIRELMAEKMYPMTLDGLGQAIKALS